MAEVFATASEAEKPKSLRYAYVPNFTARLNTEAGLVFDLLLEQIDHPVLWKQSIQHLLEHGAEQTVEFGPGKVLTGHMKRISQPLGKSCESMNVADTAAIGALSTFIKK
ncbi:MAG: ACP S-malonyltransferase [Actinobacteria bacterium]|nr:ACP S-malonyltransferase [Actinomycetota bacterium]